MVEVEKFLRESNKIEDVHKKEVDFEQVMEDSREAYEYLKNQEDIGHPEIKEAHRVIMDNLQPEIAGRYRDKQVYVGGHVPPPPSRVTLRMGEVVKKTPGKEEEALQWHLDFERVHPFLDGNGRVGRLIYLVQCENIGVEPRLWTYEDRNEYYKLFRQDRGEVETQTQV